MSTRQVCRQATLLIGLVTGASSPLAATEITIKNDSMTDASSVTSCTCFVPGDIPAAWITAPMTGRIVALQVFWKSPLGGAPDTQETAIRIYDGSTFPAPGAVLANDGGADAEVVAPLLSDGVLNEFRFLDQAQSVPMSVPVSAGQTIAVGLEILQSKLRWGRLHPKPDLRQRRLPERQERRVTFRFHYLGRRLPPGCNRRLGHPGRHRFRCGHPGRLSLGPDRNDTVAPDRWYYRCPASSTRDPLKTGAPCAPGLAHGNRVRNRIGGTIIGGGLPWEDEAPAQPPIHDHPQTRLLKITEHVITQEGCLHCHEPNLQQTMPSPQSIVPHCDT
jgi:hypothetical protein